jgi:hypothetical protein
MVLKMIKSTLFCLLALLVVLPLLGCGGSEPSVGLSDENLIIAESFVKNAATYKYDGIPETFKLSDTVSVGNGIQYVFEFDCRHAGYGDRTGQVLAQVINHHVAMVIVQNKQVISALLDGHWDMIHQKDLNLRGT